MKNRAKKTARAAILILLCATCFFVACNKTGGEDYKKEINTKEIASELCKKTPTASAWIGEDQNFIKEYVNVPAAVKDSQVYYAQNTNDLDEFGIFWVEAGHEKEVRTVLTQGYLQKRYNENREWYDSYMPAETHKLRDAEVRIYGNCVAYAILSPENKTTFFAECEKLLKNQE